MQTLYDWISIADSHTHTHTYTSPLTPLTPTDPVQPCHRVHVINFLFSLFMKSLILQAAHFSHLCLLKDHPPQKSTNWCFLIQTGTSDKLKENTVQSISERSRATTCQHSCFSAPSASLWKSEDQSFYLAYLLYCLFILEVTPFSIPDHFSANQHWQTLTSPASSDAQLGCWSTVRSMHIRGTALIKTGRTATANSELIKSTFYSSFPPAWCYGRSRKTRPQQEEWSIQQSNTGHVDVYETS